MPAHAITPRLDLSPIKRLLALIEERCRPVAVWLFGSRAKGTAGPESDWDLLVVLPDSVPFEQQDKVVDAIQLRSLSQVDADILSCGESDFKAATDSRTLSHSRSPELDSQSMNTEKASGEEVRG